MIALGRLFMAALFLIAVWLELGNPAEAPPATAILAVAYMFFAAAILVATWNSWWADARLAGAAHSARHRHVHADGAAHPGLHQPVLHLLHVPAAVGGDPLGVEGDGFDRDAVTLLYLIVGLVDVKATADFNLQRFLVRTGHLVILSLILIWFGINQWRSRFSLSERELLANPSVDYSPVEACLRAAVAAVRASRGAFAWWEQGNDSKSAATLSEGELGQVPLDRPPVADPAMQSAVPLRSRKKPRAVPQARAQPARIRSR